VLSLSEFFMALQPDAFPAGELTGPQFWDLLTHPRVAIGLMVRHGIIPSEFLYPVDGGGRFSGGVDLPPICMAALPHLTADPDDLFDELAAVVPRFATAAVGQQYQRLFDWMAARFDRSVVVERSGGSLAYLRELRDLFPDARFVHVGRDAASCALSMREHHAFRLYRIGHLLEKSTGVNPFLSTAPYDIEAVPEHLRPLIPESFDVDAYRSFDIPAAEFGLMWSTMVVRGLPVLKELPPDRLYTVHYEDLVADPPGTLAQLRRFMGLEDRGEEWATGAAARVRPPRTRDPAASLSAEEVAELTKSTTTASRYLRRFEAARMASEAHA